MTALFPMYRLSVDGSSTVLETPFWSEDIQAGELSLDQLRDLPIGWSGIGNTRVFKTRDDHTIFVISVSAEMRNVVYCAPFFDEKGCPKEDAIQSYVLRAIEGTIEAVNDKATEFVDFLHSIRSVLGALVHESTVGRGIENDRHQLAGKLRKLNELSAALDAEAKYYIFEYEGGASDQRVTLNIRDITYKIGRLVPYLSGKFSKNVVAKFEGESHNCVVEGPDVFEIIPYKLIENAIKYSLIGGRINIRVWRSENKIFCEVQSMGPELQDGEEKAIFERGVRGYWAKRLGVGGFGVGLSQVKSVCEEGFSGTVVCVQERTGSAVTINGVPYRSIVFRVVIPAGLHGERGEVR